MIAALHSWRWIRLPVLVLMLLATSMTMAANEDRLQIVSITDSVYAIVGDLGNRSDFNLGNNATFGLVVTSEGAVLIDSGATRAGAAALHRVIQQVTDQPVVKVINTGGQDHRWLGNDYFRSLGAEIIASRAAVEDQKARLNDQFARLSSLLDSALLAETRPAYADRQFTDSLSFSLAGFKIQVQHSGGAHTPGDSFVWLPEQRVVFTGDIVYVERMLGVIDVSHSGSWITAFETMAAVDPLFLVPGHGNPTDLQQAESDTLDYLEFLRQAVGDFIDEGNDISEISRIDQSTFSYLKNFEQLAGRNAQQVFTEMEWE